MDNKCLKYTIPYFLTILFIMVDVNGNEVECQAGILISKMKILDGLGKYFQNIIVDIT